MASATETKGKLDTLLKEQLKCPCCFEIYRRPRTLSCLHTFCERCLDAWINRNVATFVDTNVIKCPTCHTKTVAPSGAKTIKDWVKYLPLNSVFISRPDDTVTENESTTVCGQCALADEIAEAESLCTECESYLCRRCTTIHSKSSILKHHSILCLSDVTTGERPGLFDFSVLEHCPAHADEKVKFFCNSHAVLCCSTCAFIEHRKCDHVVEVKELSKIKKENQTATEIQDSMEVVVTELGDTTNLLEANVVEVSDRTTSIKHKLQVIRDNVVKQIDEVVIRVGQKANQLRDVHQSQLAERISRQKSLTTSINSSRFLLNAVLEHGSEAQIFITVLRFKEQLNQYKALQQEERDCSATVDLRLETSETMDTFLNPPGNLADIKVIEDRVEVPGSSSLQCCPLTDENKGSDTVDAEGGEDKATTSKDTDRDGVDITYCRIERVALVDLKVREGLEIPYIPDVKYLSDGRIVYVDSKNSSCCVLSTNYETIAELKLVYGPLSVEVIGDSTVVVASVGKSLYFLSVNKNSLTLTRTITCQRQPRCIVNKGGSELIVGWNDEGIGIISMVDGSERSYLDRDKDGTQIKFGETDCITVDINMSEVYRTDWDNDTMTSMAYDGTPGFTYSNDQLRRPSGIALDRDGNIYICSFSTDNVHQISPDGVLIRTIDVGVSLPNKICFTTTTGDQMAVINFKSETVPTLSVMKFVPND